MGLLETILGNQGGGDVVRQLATNFGISEADARNAMGKLVPALGQGMKRNMSSSGGIESLIGALASGRHSRYVDDPAQLGRSETVQDGNGILGHLFGDKEVSREVARRASNETGLGSDLLKKMLPVVAALVMGSLSKQASSGGLLNQLGGGAPSGGGLGGLLGQLGGGTAAGGQSAGGLGGMLGSLLDSDGDGSIADDLLGMAGRMMRG